MGAKGQGVDEGSSSVKVVEVVRKDGALLPVTAVAVAAEDGVWSGPALSSALRQAGLKCTAPVCGLSGKDLVIPYHQVPSVPEWQLRQIMDFEVEEIEKQSGDTMASDFNLLPVASDLSSDDTVLLALTREQNIEERVGRLSAASVKARYFTPNALALFHAFRLYGPAAEGDVLIANIGKTCSDLVLLRDGELLYARTAGTGGDALTEALVKEFNVSAAKAEKLKREMGDLRRSSERRGLTPQQEKVSYALESAAGRFYQLVQSTLQFAKSQIQLNQLDLKQVFLTGGSARMKGFDQSLENNLGVPVKIFDPLGDAGVEVEGEADTVDMTAALGLAVMAADPEAYSVEVLSRKARAAKQFQERTLFVVLAGLAIVGYLAFSAVRLKSEHAAATKDHGVLQAELTKRQRNEKRYDELLEREALLRERLDVLEKRRAAGESLVRALRSVTTRLPDELWIESVELDDQQDVKVNMARRPEVRVHGKGRSVGDRGEDAAFQNFVQELRSDPDLAVPGRLLEKPNPSRKDFSFDLRFDYLLPPPAATDEESADESGAP